MVDNENPGVEKAPDFTELEKSIEQLVEVVKEDFAQRETEKLEQQEKEQQAIEDELANEEIVQEIETLETEYKESLLSVQESQTDSLEILVEELQILNVTNQELRDLTVQQNDLLVEGFYFSGLSVVISFAVYMFWSQLSKW